MPTGYQIYKQDACHYVTFQIVYWVDIFSRKEYRDIIVNSLNYCITNKGLNIFAYVIMTNHVHLLISADNSNLSEVIRDFKKNTSRRLLGSIMGGSESRREWMLKLFAHAATKHVRNENYQVWTHENHAEEIYSPKFTLQKIKYIHDNPVRAGIVSRPEDYLYSSAVDYSGEKGLVAVTALNLHMLMS